MVVFKNVCKKMVILKKLYKKWYFLKFFKLKNLIQIYTKTHQIAPFIEPQNPPSKAHGFAMRSMSLRDMQISKSQKKIIGPPLPNPGDALIRLCKLYLLSFILFLDYTYK